MSQLELYYRTQLRDKVTLLPEQCDANIDDHLLVNLKQKVEGKVGDNGMVLYITRIINYDNGIIDGINLMSSTVYDIYYECFFCSPTEGMELICVIDKFVKGLLVVRNGPIRAGIEIGPSKIDTQKFEINNGKIYYKKNNTMIDKGNYIKVEIINRKLNSRETYITAVCKLLDVASKNEIQLYEQDQKMILGIDSNDDEYEMI